MTHNEINALLQNLVLISKKCWRKSWIKEQKVMFIIKIVSKQFKDLTCDTSGLVFEMKSLHDLAASALSIPIEKMPKLGIYGQMNTRIGRNLGPFRLIFPKGSKKNRMSGFTSLNIVGYVKD